MKKIKDWLIGKLGGTTDESLVWALVHTRIGMLRNFKCLLEFYKLDDTELYKIICGDIDKYTK